jgi:hypothetical protein
MQNSQTTLKGGRVSKMQAELQRCKRDTAYYEAHQEELLEQYPEQWVAIYDERVVGADADLYHLLSTIKEQGFSPGQALVEYVTSKDEILILLYL